MLRCDLYRYFPAIDHEILKRDLRRRIACAHTLALGDRIIDASNYQEPVNLYYPGDDLFTPFMRRRGLPIGNLTSQFFANLYLDGLDHFCKEVLRARGYVRYVDDFALFHDDPKQLEVWRDRIAHFLQGRRLCLHPEKTEIVETEAPATFFGLCTSVRRIPAVVRSQCTSLPQSVAEYARPLATGSYYTRGSGHSGMRVDHVCRSCQYMAVAPCDLSRRVV